MLADERLGYVLTEFPVLRETFVLHEVLALEGLGADVTVFAFRGARPGPIQEAADRIRGEIVYTPRPGPLMLPFWYIAGLLRWPRKLLGMSWLIWRSSWRQPVWLLKSLWTLAGSCYLAREVGRRGIQHLHAHFAWMATLSAMAVADLCGITFSFTAHSHDIYLNKTLLREKLQAALFVVTISEYNRAYLAEVIPGADIEKVHVVHCGVNAADFTHRDAPDGKPVVLSVGGLVDFKGFRHLIDACHILAKRNVAFECRIVGDGQLRDELEAQIAQAGLTAQVQLVGALTLEGVRAEHGNATLYAQPSVRMSYGRQDGIPVALMEAMASGLAVVGTDVSGIPELVRDGHTGLLVPPGNPGALADTIQQLLADAKLRDRLGAAGRREVEAEFELATTSRQFASVLKTSLRHK